MIDPEFDPIIPPRYYEGYIAVPRHSDYSNSTGWDVYTYPNILIWECETREEAEQLAKNLNEQDNIQD